MIQQVEWDDEAVTWIAYVEIEPRIPARISGPPEDCYPAEGGAEVTKLELRVWDLSSKRAQLVELDPNNFPEMCAKLEELAYEDWEADQEDVRY